MTNKKTLEGYELVEALSKQTIPDNTIVEAFYKDYGKAGELIVKRDISDIFYLIWESGEEVGMSLFTDSKLEFSYQVK